MRFNAYDEDPGPEQPPKGGVVRYQRIDNGTIVYRDQDGNEVESDELLSDEALKAPRVVREHPDRETIRKEAREEAFEEAHRFLEEEANVADRKGDFGDALILRKSLRRMRERLKP